MCEICHSSISFIQKEKIAKGKLGLWVLGPNCSLRTDKGRIKLAGGLEEAQSQNRNYKSMQLTLTHDPDTQQLLNCIRPVGLHSNTQNQSNYFGLMCNLQHSKVLSRLGKHALLSNDSRHKYNTSSTNLDENIQEQRRKQQTGLFSLFTQSLYFSIVFIFILLFILQNEEIFLIIHIQTI